MRLRLVVVSLLSFALLAGVALAGSPKPGELYTSSYLTITVAKPATSVKVFVECLPSSGGGAQWTGTKIPLTHGSFKYDHSATFSKLPHGKIHGTVDVNGSFKGGKFVGTWQLVGTPCGKTSYKATAGAGGSGG